MRLTVLKHRILVFNGNDDNNNAVSDDDDNYDDSMLPAISALEVLLMSLSLEDYCQMEHTARKIVDIKDLEQVVSKLIKLVLGVSQ